MIKKRLLLTGDDGYNSIGTRLLVHSLAQDFDLTIVGTKEQQSAVGGMLHVKEGCAYRETSLDGIRAFWVDGAPADAMEFAHTYFPKGFDVVISGVNLGENVGISTVSSGTVCAAVRSIALRVAPQAIAISWTTPPDFYFRKHSETEALDAYLPHPGETAGRVIKLALAQNLFGAKLLNINLPKNTPKGIKFTRGSHFVDECYPPISLDRDKNRFNYPFTEMKRRNQDLTKDVEAMSAGYIAITPMNADWTDEMLFAKLENVETKWE